MILSFEHLFPQADSYPYVRDEEERHESFLMCVTSYHVVDRASCNLSVKLSEKEQPNWVKLTDGHAVITTVGKLDCSVLGNTL